MTGGSPNVRAATAETIAEAAARLAAGELVAFPTETVYGLGADATNDLAVAAVFKAKQRPRFNPLIVHVVDFEAAERIAEFDAKAEAVAGWHWPGPLTLVLPRRADAGLSYLVSAGLDTVAVRVPSHAIAQALLAKCGRPVAAPSANPSGRVSPTTAAHVADTLGAAAAMILDGGACPVGVESTVLDLTGPKPVLLRPGGLAVEALERRIGPIAPAGGGDRPRAPGMLARHYAPAVTVRPNAFAVHPGEALLGFGPEAVNATLNLSPRGDLQEAAANLFAMLRQLDRPDTYTAIAVMPIPGAGLGRAINDRLRRAAAPRPPAGEGTGDVWDAERGPAAPCVLPGTGDSDDE